MPRFEVLSASTIVGHSELESGDPPMGAASGRFIPLPSYSQIRSACIAARDTYQEHLILTVRLVGGETLESQAGVQIIDFSDELGPESMKVHVVGIGYLYYGELFPVQVTAYEKQFPPIG